MKKAPIEIQAAAAALLDGAPLSHVIARLENVLSAQVIASYREGLSLRACGERHSMPWGEVVTIINRDAPHIMRTHLQGFQKGHARFNANRYGSGE